MRPYLAKCSDLYTHNFSSMNTFTKCKWCKLMVIEIINLTFTNKPHAEWWYNYVSI